MGGVLIDATDCAAACEGTWLTIPRQLTIKETASETLATMRL